MSSYFPIFDISNVSCSNLIVTVFFSFSLNKLNTFLHASDGIRVWETRSVRVKFDWLHCEYSTIQHPESLRFFRLVRCSRRLTLLRTLFRVFQKSSILDLKGALQFYVRFPKGREGLLHSCMQKWYQVSESGIMRNQPIVMTIFVNLCATQILISFFPHPMQFQKISTEEECKKLGKKEFFRLGWENTILISNLFARIFSVESWFTRHKLIPFSELFCHFNRLSKVNTSFLPRWFTFYKIIISSDNKFPWSVGKNDFRFFFSIITHGNGGMELAIGKKNNKTIV